MGNTRAARLAVILLVAGAGLVGDPATPGQAAAPRAKAVLAAATATPPDLYVSPCSSNGDGSAAAPFCSISAAAAVVQPGQTVYVEAGNYNENVTLTRSGAAGSPVRFVAVNTFSTMVRLGLAGPGTGPRLTLSHVHDVLVQGFVIYGGSAGGVLIDGSSNVVIDQGRVSATQPPAVRVTGASANVTLSRLSFSSFGGVAVDAGVTGTVVTGNVFLPGSTLTLTDAPDAVITGNTLVTGCAAGIAVTGTSPGASIRNNIVDTAYRAPQARSSCTGYGTGPAIAVSAASIPQTTVDANLFDPIAGVPMYAWGGVNYTDLPTFMSATGQGRLDLAADPRLGALAGGDVSWYPLLSDSPALDSAAADAPGEPATDFLTNPRADNPAVTNTGTGAVGYHDRGAVEQEPTVGMGGQSLSRVAGGGPTDTLATQETSYSWVTSGPIGTFEYVFDDVGFPLVSRVSSQPHTFRTAGAHCFTGYISMTNMWTGTGEYARACTVVGAWYTPVTPTRVLDTRYATGVGTTTPVPAHGEVVLKIGTFGQTNGSAMSAVVLNVTVTAPTTTGYITVYADGSSRPTVSNLDFVAGQTVPNLVTVPLNNGTVRLYNGSSGTVHLIADLQGYYTPAGSPFTPVTPKRVLDTRTGTGTGGVKAPVGTGATLTLDLSGAVPAGATAVVLNVTATQPTGTGLLTVYPYGQPRPLASNLNFLAGQTVPNLVVVPVASGKVNLYHGGAGTVHVVADLTGWFGTASSGARLAFVPLLERIVDTRYGTGYFTQPAGTPLGAGATGSVYPDFLNGFNCGGPTGACPVPLAAVMNVTVTQPTRIGYLTLYPNGLTRPLASNLNFLAGQTVPNLTMIGDRSTGIAVYNGSAGSTHVVIDEQGYFIAPAS